MIVTIYWVQMTHVTFKPDRDDILGLIVTIYWSKMRNETFKRG